VKNIWVKWQSRILALQGGAGVVVAECDLSQKGGGRVCKYMHARARPIHNVMTQCRTVQKDGSNPPNRDGYDKG